MTMRRAVLGLGGAFALGLLLVLSSSDSSTLYQPRNFHVVVNISQVEQASWGFLLMVLALLALLVLLLWRVRAPRRVSAPLLVAVALMIFGAVRSDVNAAERLCLARAVARVEALHWPEPAMLSRAMWPIYSPQMIVIGVNGQCNLEYCAVERGPDGWSVGLLTMATGVCP